jgi:hypothetical protein
MKMNKFVGFAAAVLLCMFAAGFGAYLALRQETAVARVAESGTVGVPAAQAPSGSPSPANSPAPAPVAAQDAAVPAASVAESLRTKVLEPAKPSPSPIPAADSVSGGVAAIPPASANVVTAPGAATVPPAAAEPSQPPVAEPPTPAPPAPPQKVLEELVVAADSVIGLRIENTVSSEVAKIEDPVEARVTRDVRVGSEVAIPTGARVLGSVVQVERGGKMKTAARVGVRFHTLVLPDATRLPMQTEAIYREGKSPGQESAAKVGAATVGGAILGAIIGGGKGAAIGGAVGAAGGTGAVMAGGRNPAVLSSGTSLTIRLSQPVTIIVEREETAAR